MTAKQILKRLIIRVIGTDPSHNISSSYDIWPWLRSDFDFRTLIDLGANTGEFGEFIAKYLGVSAVHAFEPLPACQPDLEKRAKALPNMTVYPVGLSDWSGESAINENAQLSASSFLPITERHRTEFPHAADVGPVKVAMRRLDDLLDADGLEDDVFIKMDVQGLEDQVIKGGQKVFAKGRVVYVEMGFEELFAGQALFGEVHKLLDEMDYRFSGISNQISSKETGQPLFCHCVYVKARATA